MTVKKAKIRGWTVEEEKIIAQAIREKRTERLDIENLAQALERPFNSVQCKLWRFKNGIKRQYPKKTAKEWEKTTHPYKKSPREPKIKPQMDSRISVKLAQLPDDAPKKLTIRDFKQIFVEGQNVTIYF